MSSVVLSARNAVAVYVSDDGTLGMSAKLAFAVMLRFLPVRLLAVALGCVLDAFSLKSRTLCQNIDIGPVCNVACRLENSWVNYENVAKTNPESNKSTLKRGVSVEVGVSFGRNGQPLRPKCGCISAEILRLYQLYKAPVACFSLKIARYCSLKRQAASVLLKNQNPTNS